MREDKEPVYTKLTEEVLSAFIEGCFYEAKYNSGRKMSIYMNDQALSEFDRQMKEFVKDLPTCGQAYDKQNQIDEDNK